MTPSVGFWLLLTERLLLPSKNIAKICIKILSACRVGGCVFPTLMLVYAPTKLIFAFFNIIIGVCFFYFLTKYNKNHGSSNNDEVAQRKRKIVRAYLAVKNFKNLEFFDQIQYFY